MNKIRDKLAMVTCPECGLVMYGLRMRHDLMEQEYQSDKLQCGRCRYGGVFKLVAVVDPRPMPHDAT